MNKTEFDSQKRALGADGRLPTGKNEMSDGSDIKVSKARIQGTLSLRQQQDYARKVVKLIG